MIKVKITQSENGMVELIFTSDTGKFETSEILDCYLITPQQLLEALQTDEALRF
jgi:hypothetical protein